MAKESVKDKDKEPIKEAARNSKKGVSKKGQSKDKDDKKSSRSSRASTTSSNSNKQSTKPRKPSKRDSKSKRKTTKRSSNEEGSKPGRESQPEPLPDPIENDKDKDNKARVSRPSSPRFSAGQIKPQVSSNKDEGNEDQFGMYRKVPPTGVGRLDPLHKAFARFHPWRPKGNAFITTGYYPDMDMGGGGYGLRPNEVMIHNIPGDMTERGIRKEFPSATKVTFNSDDTVRLEFRNHPDAEKAYFNNSSLVKLGNRHLGWMNPDEVYLVGVPADMTDDDVLKDYPGSKSATFIETPGARRTAIIKFPNEGDADKDFQKSPYKKLGNRQNGYEMDDNPIRLTNVPPDLTEDDIRQKFPGAKDIAMDPSGTVSIRFAGNDEARKAYNTADMAHLGKPKLAWIQPNELALEGVPNNATESSVKKDFPNATTVRLLDSDGGKKVAIVGFHSEADQKKGFGDSRHKKLGPQRLGYAGAKADPNAVLKIQGIPKGVTADDLRKQFGNATDVTVDGKGNATLQFTTPTDANRAYEDADMAKLKNRKLAYLAPNQLALEELPKKLKEGDIRKDFPLAKNITILEGPKGHVAIAEFPTEADQKHAFTNSHHTKVGPQRLEFDGKAGGDPTMQVKLNNLPSGMTQSDIQRKFPGAIAVTMEKGGQAIVHYDSPADATKAYNKSDMGKMGNNNLAYLGPNQIAVAGLKDKKDKKIKKHFPNAKRIHWIDGPNKTHVAIVDFPDPSKMKSDFDNTTLQKTGPQSVDVGTGGGAEDDEDLDEGLDDMEMAKKLWKLKGAEFSNISNLFSASIRLTNIPMSTKGVDLIKMFEDCKKCEFQGSGAGRAAILEFDKPTSAAKAYSKAKKLKIDGKEIQVKVIPLGGGKKKGTSKTSQGTTAKRNK